MRNFFLVLASVIIQMFPKEIEASKPIPWDAECGKTCGNPMSPEKLDALKHSIANSLTGIIVEKVIDVISENKDVILRSLGNDLCILNVLEDDISGFCCRAHGYDLHHSGSYYKLKTVKKNWQDARADCQAEGGDLVVINSDSEFQFLTGIIKAWTWVGMSDLEREGTYKWVDGTTHNPTSVNWWSVTQPDRSGDCIQFLIRGGIGLDDYVCSISQDYICEKKGCQ